VCDGKTRHEPPILLLFTPFFDLAVLFSEWLTGGRARYQPTVDWSFVLSTNRHSQLHLGKILSNGIKSLIASYVVYIDPQMRAKSARELRLNGSVPRLLRQEDKHRRRLILDKHQRNDEFDKQACSNPKRHLLQQKWPHSVTHKQSLLKDWKAHTSRVRCADSHELYIQTLVWRPFVATHANWR
jgi:hypothetical protein